ncbi:MAG TPA: ubiquinol-cytochrome c reductase iron-sulfur subunit [Chloroflexota bacterium]
MNLTRKLVSREFFMIAFMAGVGGIGTIVVGLPIVGVLLGALFRAPADVWRDVGAIDSFTVGHTVEVTFTYNQGEVQQWSGPTQVTAAWLRRNSTSSFTAFAVYCTHLGCPVHWLAEPRIFLCPCHGSVFNGNGTVAGGPAPRPLFQYPVRVVNGRVQIKTAPIPVST